jgi:exonuclease VII small subunit
VTIITAIMESETSPLNTSADEARQRGNNLYKQGKLRQAQARYGDGPK